MLCVCLTAFWNLPAQLGIIPAGGPPVLADGSTASPSSPGPGCFLCHVVLGPKPAGRQTRVRAEGSLTVLIGANEFLQPRLSVFPPPLRGGSFALCILKSSSPFPMPSVSCTHEKGGSKEGVSVKNSTFSVPGSFLSTFRGCYSFKLRNKAGIIRNPNVQQISSQYILSPCSVQSPSQARDRLCPSRWLLSIIFSV